MCTAVQPKDRRFIRRCQAATAASLVVYIVSSQLSLRAGTGVFGLSLAALAGVAFFGECAAVGFLVMRRLDEFQRGLMTQSFLWGTVLTMLLVMTYGSLELHGNGRVPQVSLLAVPVALIVITCAAKLLIFRRHRPASD